MIASPSVRSALQIAQRLWPKRISAIACDQPLGGEPEQVRQLRMAIALISGSGSDTFSAKMTFMNSAPQRNASILAAWTTVRVEPNA